LLNGSARRCPTTSTASSQMPGTDRIRFGSWPFESCHTRSMDEIPRHGCNCGMGMVIVACVRENCRNLSPNLRGANCYSWEHFYLCKPWEALVRPSEALADSATLVRMDPLHAGSDTLRFLGAFLVGNGLLQGGWDTATRFQSSRLLPRVSRLIKIVAYEPRGRTNSR
jgi:hypothetical protein